MQSETLSHGLLRQRQPLIPVFSRSFGSWHVAVGRRGYDPDTLAAHYDRQSETWHTVIDRHGFSGAYENLIARVLRQERYRQGSDDLNVLDAGIGTGAMGLALSRVVKHRFRLHGVDISEAMLLQAELRLRHRDIDLHFDQANLADLPFADGHFDIVLMAHVVEHLADPAAALAELYRVLKPGGVLICAITRQSRVGAYIQWKWRTHQVSQRRARQWLRDAGFRSVRAAPFARGSAPRRFSIGYVGRKPG